jgi:hypothetical protein
MAGMLFSVADLLHEMEAMEKLASDFLENENATFKSLRYQLEGLQNAEGSHGIKWEIPDSKPLTTVVSRGEFERSGKGANVFGTLSFAWEIQRVPEKKKKRPAATIRLTGLASTVLRIFRQPLGDEVAQELAMWRIESGDEASPGCHFHVQVLGRADEGLFPKYLSVPRLPSYFVTPFAGLEFLLGELFQLKWNEHAFKDGAAQKSWRAIQRFRFERLFDWQRKVVTGSTSTPWSSLKASKPCDTIFQE